MNAGKPILLFITKPETTMQETRRGGTLLYQFENLSQFPEISHFVSTREGGVSQGNFSGLNLGFRTGDDHFRVLQNRRILADAIGIGLEKFTFAMQNHTANINLVDSKGRGRGSAEHESALENTDAMITSVEKICLTVQTADCVPVLLYDPVERVIAAVHAGWKGTLKKVTGHTIEKMIQNYGCKAENILAAMGPANGPCCYEVGEDVCRETRIALGSTKGILHPAKKPGKFIFDQWNANRLQMIDYGIREDHIETAETCTQCRHETFFSSRAHNGVTGRQAAGIMLMKKH